MTHQFTHRSSSLQKSGSDLSIVPDSEPEPEPLGPISETNSPLALLHQPNTTEKKLEIIELSDSDESIQFERGPSMIVPDGQPFPLTVKDILKPPVDILDDEGRKKANESRFTRDGSGSKPSIYPAPSGTLRHSPSPSQDSEDDCEPCLRPNKLACFAFAGKPVSSKTPRARSTSVKSAESETVVKLSNSKIQYSHTEEGIRRLTRCVACNLAWTSRKTAAAKLDHIRKCQKKHDFTDEAIAIRIAQELSKPPEAKDSLDEVANQDVAQTLMENVLKDTQPKKRSRRKEVITTVVDIQYRHEIIRARAETLFAFSRDENHDPPSHLSTPRGNSSTNGQTRQQPRVHEYPTSRLGTNKGYSLILDDHSNSTGDPLDNNDLEETTVPPKRKRDISLSNDLAGFSPPWL